MEKAEAWKQKYKIPDKNIYNYNTLTKLPITHDIEVI
jgi:glucose-fructose oxidoreductase